MSQKATFLIILILVGIAIVIGGLTIGRGLQTSNERPPLTNSVTPSPEPLPQTISVYFSQINPTDCTEVLETKRQVAFSPDLMESAINVLLQGPTEEEVNRGLMTSIPPDTQLLSVRLENGVAYTDFNQNLDPGGGSCLVQAIRAQIEQTLLQFPTVTDVVISIEGNTDAILQP